MNQASNHGHDIESHQLPRERYRGNDIDTERASKEMNQRNDIEAHGQHWPPVAPCSILRAYDRHGQHWNTGNPPRE